MTDNTNPLLVLAGNSRIMRIPKGQTLLRRGEGFDRVYILREGIVLMNSKKDGTESILHVFKPLALLPLAFFSGPGTKTQWEYKTLTECQVNTLPLKDVNARLTEDGGLSFELAKWFSQQVHELLTRLSSLSKSDIREKMMAAFKFLGTHLTDKPKHGWAKVSFPVTYKFIADMTGVTREGVSKNISYFQENKLVRTDKPLTLEINVKKLGISRS